MTIVCYDDNILIIDKIGRGAVIISSFYVVAIGKSERNHRRSVYCLPSNICWAVREYLPDCHRHVECYRDFMLMEEFRSR